ncbi:MAG: hypothetical protein AAF416_00565 [Pseudomonadota bacterium]
MTLFLRSESGATAIDWVALAAGLLVLGVALVDLISDETGFVIDTIEDRVGDQPKRISDLVPKE